MPSGLSRAKTTLRGLFRNKDKETPGSQAAASTSVGDSSTRAPDIKSNDHSDTPPSKAPQLEHPNTSSARLNRHRIDATEESEDDMNAAVMAAGGGTDSKMKSKSDTTSAPAQDKNLAPPHSSNVKPHNAGPEIDSVQRAVASQSGVADEVIVDTRNKKTATEDVEGLAGQKNAVPPTDSEQVFGDTERASFTADQKFPSDTHITQTQTQPETDTLVSAQHSTDNTAVEVPTELSKPTEQEIEDAEIREAQAAVQASKAYGTDSEAKIDAETAAETDNAMRTAVVNSGAAGGVTGMGMGMSATSGPMSDMPMA